jgi:hypothetical protein
VVHISNLDYPGSWEDHDPRSALGQKARFARKIIKGKKV